MEDGGQSWSTTNNSRKPLRRKRPGGRRRTRSTIIETLLGRGYITREEKILAATDAGRYLIALIPRSRIEEPELQGDWESRLRGNRNEATYGRQNNHGRRSTRFHSIILIDNLRQEGRFFEDDYGMPKPHRVTGLKIDKSMRRGFIRRKGVNFHTAMFFARPVRVEMGTGFGRFRKSVGKKRSILDRG